MLLGLLMASAKGIEAADHRDGAAAKAAAATDINDVYAFMSGGKLSLVMTVSPNAMATAKFSDQALYVFHLSSMATFGAATKVPLKVICSFDNAATQTAQCWAGSGEFVTGNAAATTGISSTSGKLKVFAGRRADPFFFNLKGFLKAALTVATAVGLPTPDAAGCVPALGATADALVMMLRRTDPDGAPVNDFAGQSVLSIVVDLDTSLLTGGPIVGVHGSTNRK